MDDYDYYMYDGAGGWAGSQATEEEEPQPYHIPPGYAPGYPCTLDSYHGGARLQFPVGVAVEVSQNM